MTTASTKPQAGRARVVYLVLSHKNVDQISRLVDQILSGSELAHVLLAHDQSRCPLPVAAFTDQPRVTVMPPIRVRWGGWSQVEAVLQGMRWALRHLEFDWLCFISGQDYPLQPISWTERELGEATVDAFMEPPETVRCFSGDWLSPEGEGVRRYLYRYWTVSPTLARLAPGRPRRAAEQAIVRMERRLPYLLLYPLPGGERPRVGLRRVRSPFSAQAPCRKGSEAGSYSRRCVEVVEEFVRRNPHATAYFRRTISPSEAFLPTVVWNSPELGVYPDNRRCIRFQPPGALQAPPSHPDVFLAEDLNFLRESGAHFGRKFDAEVDSLILDLLDEQLSAASRLEPPRPPATAPARSPTHPRSANDRPPR